MLRFAVLGPMLVTYDEEPIDLPTAMLTPTAWRSCCANRQAVPIDLLLETLWEGQPPPSARKTLQIYVHRLRRVLGERRVLAARPATGCRWRARTRSFSPIWFAKPVRPQSGRTYPMPAGSTARLCSCGGGTLSLTSSEMAMSPATPGSSTSFACTRLERYADIELRLGRHAEIIGWLASSNGGQPLPGETARVLAPGALPQRPPGRSPSRIQATAPPAGGGAGSRAWTGAPAATRSDAAQRSRADRRPAVDVSAVRADSGPRPAAAGSPAASPAAATSSRSWTACSTPTRGTDSVTIVV